MIPVKALGDFIVCFQALPEYVSMRSHFMKDCEYTKEAYLQICHHVWFTAKVSIWKEGSQLASAYLGCCCYESELEFYTTYAGDYFADLVDDCAVDTNDLLCQSLATTYTQTLRASK